MEDQKEKLVEMDIPVALRSNNSSPRYFTIL